MGKVNEAIKVPKDARRGKNTVIGVLDIYGFEIFDNNRSEMEKNGILLWKMWDDIDV